MLFVEITAESRTIHSWICRKELFGKRTSVQLHFFKGITQFLIHYSICHGVSYKKLLTYVFISKKLLGRVEKLKSNH